MEAAADFSLEKGDQGDVAVLRGDWTTVTLGDAGPRLADALKSARAPSLDLTGIGRCDTHGAYTIVRSADGLTEGGELKARPETQRLLNLVAERTMV